MRTELETKCIEQFVLLYNNLFALSCELILSVYIIVQDVLGRVLVLLSVIFCSGSHPLTNFKFEFHTYMPGRNLSSAVKSESGFQCI